MNKKKSAALKFITYLTSKPVMQRRGRPPDDKMNFFSFFLYPVNNLIRAPWGLTVDVSNRGRLAWDEWCK